MKYLNKFTKRKIFNYNDLVLMLGNNNLAKNTLQNYLEKSYIKRIQHNLYGVVSLEANECLADKFLIVSNITESSFVSHHSAFEFYGYYTQVYNDVNVSSISKFNQFEFEKNNYSLSDEAKTKHALDSFVFNYNNQFGNKDNLKIEINYMNRAHIYETIIRNLFLS